MSKVIRTPVFTGVVIPAGGVLPQIHLFEDDSFTGDELDIYGGDVPSLSSLAGRGWNDTISSVIVVSGTWELFMDDGYGGRKLTLSPGVYGSIEQAGNSRKGAPVAGADASPPGQGWNDALSSLRAISA